MAITPWHVLAQVAIEARERAAQEAAEAEPIAEEENTPALIDWLKETTPQFNWNWPHLRYIVAQLERVLSGEINKLIIEIPPRHGKSETVTIRLPIYCMEHRPGFRAVIGAYSQFLANKFSRKAKKVAKARNLPMSRERNAAEEWETADDSNFRAVGVGGGIAGQGGDGIIIDDPVKNREEAESLAFRDKVWDWYTNDIYTRLEPGAFIIVIMTRWHKDDLVGRILASDDGTNWTRIRLPAEAEDNDPLGRSEGDALCPDRYPLSKLREIAKVLGRDYNSLYQQSPQSRDGGMFKEFWFADKYVDAIPAGSTRIRYWDKAASSGKGDYTVGVLMAYHDERYFVEDVVRGQWESGERDKIIRATAEKERSAGIQVSTWSEQEPGSSGKDAALAFVKLLAGFSVDTQPVTGDKATRADPLASQAKAGNVFIKRAAWNTAFMAELTDFPTGKHDDQVDAASGAFNRLATAAHGPLFMESSDEPLYDYG